jgi:hypothetical protein
MSHHTKTVYIILFLFGSYLRLLSFIAFRSMFSREDWHIPFAFFCPLTYLERATKILIYHFSCLWLGMIFSELCLIFSSAVPSDMGYPRVERRHFSSEGYQGQVSTFVRYMRGVTSWAKIIRGLNLPVGVRKVMITLQVRGREVSLCRLHQ